MGMYLRSAQAAPDEGQLQVNVNSAENQFPVPEATVSIARTEEPDIILERVQTNSSGQTEQITLPTPPLEFSMEPEQERPYAEYTITIQAEGFEPTVVTGSELLPGIVSIQPVRLKPLEEGGEQTDIWIGDHTLYGEYPPKIAEAEIKPVQDSGEIVLSRVVVPEIIVVHDGTPSDDSAANYFIPYRDYIKNVASSEIYATWPYSTIVANVLAILSFSLNRVYTEW